MPEGYLAVIQTRSDSPARHPRDGVVDGPPGALSLVVRHNGPSLPHERKASQPLRPHVSGGIVAPTPNFGRSQPIAMR